jgi:hypothetical protein
MRVRSSIDLMKLLKTSLIKKTKSSIMQTIYFLILTFSKYFQK